MIRIVTVAAGILLAAVIAAAPSDACGCGIAIQASMPAERALIVTHDGREQLVVSFDVLSKGAHGAVVLPVPARPKVDAVHGDIFGYLDRATPVAVTSSAPSGNGEAAAAAPPVHVISNRRIGGYQVAVLGAGSQAGALSTWLSGHGYKLPAGAQPILASYLKQGWSFVAVRLAHRASGALTPLRIRFKSTRAIYPMRLEQLGTEPVSVDLWVVGPKPVNVPQLDETYAGAVSRLKPAVPVAFKRYLDGTQITRLEGDDLDPQTLRTDFVAYPTNAAFVFTHSSAPSAATTTEPRWWVWLLLAAGLAALVAFIVAMVRRA